MTKDRKVMTPTQRKKARSASAHGTRIKATYNITREEYQLILAHQGGCCAICQRRPRYRLAVDHCHRTGLVRGLLCKLCNNRLLPAARDTVAVFWRAIRYLRRPPAVAALGGPRYVPDPKAPDA